MFIVCFVQPPMLLSDLEPIQWTNNSREVCTASRRVNVAKLKQFSKWAGRGPYTTLQFEFNQRRNVCVKHVPCKLPWNVL